MRRSVSPLLWMVLFLIGVGLMALLASAKLMDILRANPFFNSVILLVLLVGSAHAFRQVLLVEREGRWLTAFKKDRSLSGRKIEAPRLLGALALWFGHGDKQSISAPTQRTVIDSVSLRLEEARDLLRYLSGLSIFLGLLGTFWGLLVTIASVTDIIGMLRVEGDAVAMFTDLKEKIRIPLGGMATSFSTSLFGLSSSLIIGFLDLQVGQAQNHFLVDLEAWLAGMTDVRSDSRQGPSDRGNLPEYIEGLLEKMAEGLERVERALVLEEKGRRDALDDRRELNHQIARLADAVLRDGGEKEALRVVLEDMRKGLAPLQGIDKWQISVSEDLRAEFRLLTRTLARAPSNRPQEFQ